MKLRVSCPNSIVLIIAHHFKLVPIDKKLVKTFGVNTKVQLNSYYIIDRYDNESLVEL